MSVELDPATGEVLIPTNDYHQARISLAAQGLPEYASNGFEEIDNLPLGVSRSVETMKLKNFKKMSYHVRLPKFVVFKLLGCI